MPSNFYLVRRRIKVTICFSHIQKYKTSPLEGPANIFNLNLGKVCSGFGFSKGAEFSIIFAIRNDSPILSKLLSFIDFFT